MRSVRNEERRRSGATATATRRGGALAEWALGVLGLLLFAGALVHEAWPRLSSTRCPRWPADILAIEGALEEYAALHGAWPEGLDALVRPDERGQRLLDRTPVPRDPWGREYRWIRPERLDTWPRVYSLGADGEPGGEGEDRDLDNLRWLLDL